MRAHCRMMGRSSRSDCLVLGLSAKGKVRPAKGTRPASNERAGLAAPAGKEAVHSTNPVLTTDTAITCAARR
eukprot:1698468-Prymnesium_polylepis.2